MNAAKFLSLCLLLMSTGAMADDWYVLGEVTHSKDKLDTSHTDALLANAGATGLSSDGKSNGNQWRLQLGYQINPNVAVEGGYIDFGKAKYSATYTNPGSASGTVKAGGVDVAVLGILPVTDSVSLFGKLGAVAAHVKSDITATGVTSPGSSSANVVAPLLGLGASFKVGDATEIRTEFDHVSKLGKSDRTDKLTSDMLSIGLAYHFR